MVYDSVFDISRWRGPVFSDGHTAKRPALQLDLLNGSKRLSGFAIIDSGADHCIFPLSFATQLGLDPLAMKGSSVAGLGGVSNTLYWPVRLEFPGTTLQLDVYAGFSASMDAIGAGFGLLGQGGFFDRVNVSFHHRDGVFAVEVDDPPAPAVITNP